MGFQTCVFERGYGFHCPNFRNVGLVRRKIVCVIGSHSVDGCVYAFGLDLNSDVNSKSELGEIYSPNCRHMFLALNRKNRHLSLRNRRTSRKPKPKIWLSAANSTTLRHVLYILPYLKVDILPQRCSSSWVGQMKVGASAGRQSQPSASECHHGGSK